MENPDFLKQKYNLHNEVNQDKINPVRSAVRRVESQTGEKVSQNPSEQIQKYLDRLEHLILDPKKEQERYEMEDGSKRPRALRTLREMVMDEYVRPNKEKLAQGAAIVEERAARQIGITMEYNEEQLAERGEIAVKDLEGSLDQWISYLSDMNEPYPAWFRYYAFRSILELGEYDKDKREFPKRTAGTNRLFPDIDRGALARIEDIINCSKDSTQLERFRRAQRETQTPEGELLTVEKAKAFANSSFAKQYAESIQEAGEITPEMRAETRGKWIKYSQDSDPTALWASLQNKGTAWCTKGFATAETQLKGGDFYVYYTLDKQGEPKIPRIAIRMQNGNIFEARGVADSKQNLEGNMVDIAGAKMSELPGKEKYQKISADMRKMTEIEGKTKTGESFTKADLTFLYELDAPIEGFGYDKDPRIATLRDARDTNADLPILFECAPENIARSVSEVSENTKAYIGPLEPGIFDALPQNLEQVYTKFPEERIKFRNIELDTGIQNGPAFQKAIEGNGMEMSNWAKDLLNSPDFKVVGERADADLVEVSVAALGFGRATRYDAICARAQELGLELCPPEVGPQLRLQYQDQPNGEYLGIAMKAIRDSDGYPDVFYVHRNDDELWLLGIVGRPDYVWNPDIRFVFLRPRK